jgi:hypothetical protein
LLIPHITTTAQVEAAAAAIARHKQTTNSKKLLRLPGLNAAFSQSGLDALSIKDSLGDDIFKNGQLADAEALGDPGFTDTHKKFHPFNWLHPFRGTIDGVFLITGESVETVRSVLKTLEETFDIHDDDPVIVEVATLWGNVRPGDEAGHEHVSFSRPLQLRKS